VRLAELEVVGELEAERAVIEANRELAARFEQKLQSRIAEIWGEPLTLSSEKPPAKSSFVAAPVGD
jgi:hypothetical protein